MRTEDDGTKSRQYHSLCDFHRTRLLEQIERTKVHLNTLSTEKLHELAETTLVTSREDLIHDILVLEFGSAYKDTL